jgi:uncharacterized ferredoxin-like protein
MKNLISIAALIMVMLANSCASQHASTSGKIKNESAPQAEATTSNDALIATWKMDKIEIANMAAKMSSFSSQADKDKLTQTLELYQSAMAGLSVTFKADNTYQSQYGNQSDVGTWELKDKKQIRTTSKVTEKMVVYDLLSIDAASIKVKYDTPDGVTLWMTFLKK